MSNTLSPRSWVWRGIGVLFTLVVFWSNANAQNNYELEVYGSDLVAPGHTMFELDSIYVLQGSTVPTNGMYPTNHALHETFEFTHGFSPTFELEVQVFSSYRSGSQGYQYVGSQLQPTWAVPDSWKWKFGAGLSLELGDIRPQFAEDTLTLEIRPILDKRVGNFYAACNPDLERSFSGASAGRGFEFSPSARVSYDATKLLTPGIEYYGAVGPVSELDTISNQQHQLFATLDLNVGEDWEINAGIGEGFTRSTDHLILKLTLGRRFGSGKSNAGPQKDD